MRKSIGNPYANNIPALFTGKLVVKTALSWVVCTNVDQNLIADQRNFSAKYLQNGEES